MENGVGDQIESKMEMEMEMDVGSNNRINFRGRRDKEKEKNQKEITGRPISVSFRLELAGDFLLRAYLLAPSTSAQYQCHCRSAAGLQIYAWQRGILPRISNCVCDVQ